MKTTSLGTKLLMTAVCLTVLAYFGVQAWLYFTDPLTTTLAYSYQVEESISVNGWLVRREQVLPDQGTGLLRLSRSEGERVPKGGQVAVVYTDEASLQRQEEIDALTVQLEQLEYARDSALDSQAALKLDTQIFGELLELRADVTADRLDAADEHISSLRSLVLKRDYTYSGSEDLDAQIQELTAQRTALQAQAGSYSKTVTAPVSGIYSAVVDGYESVLTPELLETLTPSDLTGLEGSGEASEVGKLITDSRWYYAATMTAAEAETLTAGETVTLRLTKGTDQDLEVTVDSISGEEGGRVAVVLSSDHYLSALTLLRQQSGELITGSVSGLRVPSKGLRVSEDGTTGLYCVVGRTARFKPVEVVYADEDGYALVEPDTETEGLILRVGDEIILTANDLYDGKVVR